MTPEEIEVNDPRGECYHEAGYFFASHVLLPSSRRTEDAGAYVLMYFAGDAARRRFSQDADLRCAETDYEGARALLRMIGMEAEEAGWRCAADEFVAEHWTEIEARAAKLLAFEAELAADVARGDANIDDLTQYRLDRSQALRPPAS